MPSTRVIDDCVTHANGSFKFKLKGLKRAQAHADIMRFTDPSSSATGRKDSYDLAISEIFRLDPSLLLEPIPNKYPLSRNSPESWSNADNVWRNFSDWYGNWLSRIVHPGTDYVQSVQAALELGIHPDDESVWPEKRLLCIDGWLTDPTRLALALKAGASPNRGTNWGASYLRRVISELSASMRDNRKTREPTHLRLIRCAEILLDAGTREIDQLVTNEILNSDASSANKFQDAIGHLVDAGQVSPRIREKINELMGRLQKSGCDIDYRGGIMDYPPLIRALRCLDIEGACHLIHLGCKTKDEDIVRTPGSGGIIKPLLAEAHEAGQEEYTTRIIAALMQRQLQVAGSSVDSDSESVSKPSRRRMTL